MTNMHYTTEHDSMGVYSIRNLVTGNVYIGSTTQSFRQRWQSHIRELRRGIHANERLQRAWSKYGADAFEFSVVEVVDAADNVICREQCYIDLYWGNDCYNLNPTADSARGRITSEETRQKLSIAGKGKRRDEQTRQRMSEAAKRKPAASEQTRQKRRALRLGKSMQEETRQRIAQSLLGQKRSPEVGRKIGSAQLGNERSAKGYPPLVSPDGVIYPDGMNLNKFCREHGLDTSAMLKLIKGKTSQHKGWKLSK